MFYLIGFVFVTAANLLMVAILLVLVFFELGAGAIWIIFSALARVIGVQVVAHRVHQHGVTPDSPEVQQGKGKDSVYVEFYSTRDDYFALRRKATEAGLWFNLLAFTPLGKIAEKFVYQVLVVAKWPDRK